nr:MAG TPA: hypothetical protein [Caudoviricetes sp.]DAP84576.1 MAG TPA: hypothetical protein [Caudoviricetes sp.]DAX77358.1 MAG TPA: hypothetical protein [Caudoviricetes sp.]
MTKKELEDILKDNKKEAFWDFFDFLNEFFLLLPGAIASLAILFFVFILPLLLWLGILK